MKYDDYDLPRLKFESIKIDNVQNNSLIRIKGKVDSNHPSYAEGESIWTSYVVFYDEIINMIQTANGCFYYLDIEDNDKKSQLLSILARKNKLSNLEY